MVRRARSLVVVAALASALAACNLIAGLTEDYALGPPDGSSVANEGGEDGAVDGDGSNRDAMTSEASLDATPDSASGKQFCLDLGSTDAGADAGAVVFCEDFEAVTASPFGFTSVFKTSTPDASVTVDPTGGYKGFSAGLHVVTEKAAASAAVWVEKSLVLGDPDQHRVYEAQLDFQDEASPISYTAMGILTFDDGTSPVREHGFGTFANGAQISKLSPLSDTVPDDMKWHHAVIRLERPAVGQPFNRYLRIDEDVVTVTGPMSLITTGGVELRLGTFNTGSGTGTLKARFDNIVVREW